MDGGQLLQRQQNIQAQQNAQVQRNVQAQPAHRELSRRDQRILDQREYRNAQSRHKERDLYPRTMEQYDPLPKEAVGAPGEPFAPQPNAGYKERQKRKIQAKKALRRYNQRNAPADQPLFRRREQLLATQEGRQQWNSQRKKRNQPTQGEILRQVNAGDYSNFSNLDVHVRNQVALEAFRKFYADYGLDDLLSQEGNFDPEQICRQISARKPVADAMKRLLDPALRLGISNMSRLYHDHPDLMPGAAEKLRKLDEAMTTAVMRETLLHETTQEQIQRLELEARVQHKLKPKAAESRVSEAVSAAKAQQIQMAKRLYMLHLGQLRKVEGGQPSEWDRQAAVAFSHCSRVAVTLPGGTEDAAKRMWDSIAGRRDGVTASGEENRRVATHNVVRRRVRRNADGGLVPEGETREKKTRGTFGNQWGMRVAIGGLGNAGISGRTLNNDGSCGYFYSCYRPGDETHSGAMLMGLESDAPYVTNQMGHMHDIFATPESASSLGGQRVDEVGDKYGCRTCDLSHMSALDVFSALDNLEGAMKYWQEHRSDPDVEQEYSDAMGMLSGQIMDAEQLAAFATVIDRAAGKYYGQFRA